MRPQENGELAMKPVTAKDFLLSIAGMFESGQSDISENVSKYVVDALKRKYGRGDSDRNR